MNELSIREAPMSTSPPRTTRRGQDGPPLLVPAASFAGLTIAGAVIGGSGPRPDSTPDAVLAYATANPTTAALGAVLLFGSAFPLVVYAATAVTRYRRLGVTAPGPLMGFAGAVMAAVAIVLSALFAWTSVQVAGLGDSAIAKLLSQLWFATGAFGFAAPIGLLVLGLAVPAVLLRFLPAWLAWAGTVIGVLAVLSTFGILTSALYPLIPIGRFGAVLFLLAVAVLLPRTVRDARRPAVS
ncbi:DUF4386 domain-containing protein [Pseudonocardia lacus]|uniref:DUF4386 domain-containing protein n=1 Tax=Pseudonocardia lacus TaxID=2835865 RepID=UPI001BDDA111|nr:DUF4386 domain-containing protein [Pseudonocardia lacus]